MKIEKIKQQAQKEDPERDGHNKLADMNKVLLTWVERFPDTHNPYRQQILMLMTLMRLLVKSLVRRRTT